MTDAEQRLWRALRELKGPNRFRRQHPIGAHIVDFACPAARLAIEVDGGQHAMMCEADEARSAEIADHRYRVIRFWNGDVMQNLEGVLQIIGEELNVTAPLSTSRPKGPGTEEGPARCLRNAHLTLPAADATGPLPLLPQAGGEG